MNAPLIYNLFPRLVGPLDRWGEHGRRAMGMGFNWIYVNPWHYPGFSGSLYAPKDFRRLNPLFVPAGADDRSLEPLKAFLREMAEVGLPVMMDLVVNHTSKDSPLVEEHPSWYVRDSAGNVVSPSATDPDDPTNVTVWGDLAEIDNENSPDRKNLWNFWAEIVREGVEMGFAGFRCDAAYMVPAGLWRHLIEEARQVRPETRFFAETLGAPVDAVLALREAGFDFFFNSSKWWDFRGDWALEQHEKFGRIAPSVSFPETHDTTRIAGDTGGDEAVQRQRYSFAAAFSAGLMMPVGYEFGFRKQVNVVSTMPSDWERRHFDLQAFVGGVNRLKLREPVLQTEGHLKLRSGPDSGVVVLERRVDGVPEPAYIVVNTDAATDFDLAPVTSDATTATHSLHRVCVDGSAETPQPLAARIPLERAEVVYLLPKKDS
jgi:starch synthase (maltosyl-transferring)